MGGLDLDRVADREVVLGINADAWVVFAQGGVGDDGVPDAGKIGPEESGVDVLISGRGAGGPGDDEVALGIDGYGRGELVLRPAGDGEGSADLVAGRVEHLGLDVVIGWGVLGGPGDHGAAAGGTGEDGVVGG